ncbi:MAG: hypothetical protein AMXMBFR36_31570 [Acidobacteriota bacterium]
MRSLFLENPTIGDTGPQEGDGFGFALAAGDFDGDGHEDLAVGMPFDSGPIVAPLFASGAVVVYFGRIDGTLDTIAPRRLTQIPGSGFEELDQHGFALAAGDFDGDGFDDLAVGAPGEALGATTATGAVFVYPGGSSGPHQDDFLLYTQATIGIPETAEPSDSFGATLASGDFDDDGFDDLAIAAPGESLEGQAAAGWVVAIPGSGTGPDPSGAFGFSQVELAGNPETGDRFGLALAAGDWNGDGFDELAVGVPQEDAGTGALHLLFGSASGLTLSGAVVLDDFLLGGFTESGDRFADELAFGDFDGDGFDDLVVGVPGEDLPVAGGGTIQNAGQVVAAYGAVGVPTLGLVQHWRESDLQGSPGPGDTFGSSLVAADFDGDGHDELAIGHVGEDGFAGAVSVVGGSTIGLVSNRRRRFATGAEGVPGIPPGTFAAALGAGDFDGDGFAELAIGSTSQSVGGIELAGAATVLRGAQFADGFESDSLQYWTIPVSSLEPRSPTPPSR